MRGRWVKAFWVNAVVTAVLFALTSSGIFELALAALLAAVVVWSLLLSQRGGSSRYPTPTWVPWFIAAILAVNLLDLIVGFSGDPDPLDVALAASLVSLTVFLFLLDREQRAISN